MTKKDTICALASGAGRAAIAVIRMSGPATSQVLRELCGVGLVPRQAHLRTLRDPRRGTPIDRGLVISFHAPSSFTGEDMAELHVHGGRAVIASVIDAILSVPGLRLAEPGEFAARAFENGKLDLTEVEGLADLIDAETEAQRRQALAQAEGSLRSLYEGWRERLVKAQALAEAGLDFVDEADVAADVAGGSDAIVSGLAADIERHLADRRGERLRDGFRVVIAGAPNAGKSSLLNALARRDAAIVSEEAGTTRDVIEVHLDLGGLPVILIDTAGLREAVGAIEAEGIRRALARAETADLVLWLIDATAPIVEPPTTLTNGTAPVLSVINKADINPSLTIMNAPAISAWTGSGVDELVEVLSARAREALSGDAGSTVLSRTRHRTELEAALTALRRALEPGLPEELKAEELRTASLHLGRLTGRVDVEEVLGAIFSEFCIGK